MGYSSEQRDRLKTSLCGARKKNGTTCRAFAGQGTDHLGVGVCKYHGGATQAHAKRAVALEAKRRMVTLGQPLDRIAPSEALDGLLRASAGHVYWLRDEITGLDDLGTNEAAVLLKMYDAERDRLTRISEVALKSGLTEEHVRLTQAKAHHMVTIVMEAIQGVELSEDQRRALGASLRVSVAKHRGGLDGEDPAEAERRIAEGDAQLAKLREKIKTDHEARINAEAERRAAKLAGLIPASEMRTSDDAPVPAPAA